MCTSESLSQGSVEDGIAREKRRLRGQIRALLRSHSGRSVLDRAVCRRVMSLPCWQEAAHVFGYFPYYDEVNVLPLLECAREAGLLAGVAVRRDAACVEFFDRCGRAIDLANYPFRKTLVLVPSRACTREGVRLGRGRGAYDRLGALHKKHHFLSPVYSFQLLDTLPLSSYDTLVQSVVTDKEAFCCRDSAQRGHNARRT